MLVSVIGLGYIGLPTAALIASKGVKVIGVDNNPAIVKTIKEGKIHIVEPDLDNFVESAIDNGNLKVSLKPVKANVFIIAVPTPFKSGYEPDLSYVKAAAKAISPLLEKDNLVILESTSPVGTTEKLIEWMFEERADLSFPREFNQEVFDISVAYCPERVLPGNVMNELVENDRIIGGVTPQCSEKACNFYNIFIESECLITNSRTAELSKLVENSFRDVNIAFANELSLICDQLKINVWEMIRLANRHPRVDILKPGPGVGGHCIAVDPWFIVHSSPAEARLIKLARNINDQKPIFVINKVKNSVLNIKKKNNEIKIALLGLSFKPNIDDLRGSPAIEIVRALGKLDFKKHYLVEPNIKCLPEEFNSSAFEITSLKKAIISSDIIVLLVDHKQFSNIDLNLLSGKEIIDTRGIWSSV
jgi:UDP-N-acetyl-D-mannosaminuronic acid dehydrogenase